MEFLTHETHYRMPSAMQRLKDARITVCGAGALGANAAESLARQGVGTLVLIDRDRVEESNLCTQPYLRTDVGAPKARVMAHALTRAVGCAVSGQCLELGTVNARKLLKGSTLVLELFDNTVSRALVQKTCAELGIPCVHAGTHADYSEITWDPGYRVPDDTGLDPCNYPLARNLVLLTVAALGEVVVDFLVNGVMRNLTLTLRDLCVRESPRWPPGDAAK